MSQYAFSFGVALAGSIVFTFLVRQSARKLALVAKPRPDRWHRKPTALFGGVGIYAGFLLSYLLRRPAEAEGDALLVLCASGMFLLGLVDDRVQLKPYAKLVGRSMTDAEIERRFRRFGPWAGLAFWLMLTRSWVPEEPLAV